MRATIELDTLMRAIARQQAEINSYDRLSGCDNDLTEMYSVAFYDGMKYILYRIENSNPNDKS